MSIRSALVASVNDEPEMSCSSVSVKPEERVHVEIPVE